VFAGDRFNLIDRLEVGENADFDLLLRSNADVLPRRGLHVKIADVGAVRVRVRTVFVPPEVEWRHLYVTTAIHERYV